MKKIIIALNIIPALSCAISSEQIEATHKANIEILRKKGLPTPDSGIQLVPQESFKMENWRKEQFNNERKEMLQKGYVEKSSNRAYFLLNLPEKIAKIKALQVNHFKVTDSHLRQNAQEIPFAYTYVGVPNELKLKFYGIAPAWAYSQEAQKGWTGAVEYFKSNFAHCAYTENNIKASHGAGRIAEEVASYTVNGKITLIDVEGNESTGFLYHVNWFDELFNRNLECASNKFSKETLNNTIDLAQKIDSAYS